MSKVRTDRFRNFLWLFTSVFSSLAATFLVLKYVYHWNYPIATLYRMFAYHNQYPFQYIAIVAVMFGMVGSHWIDLYGRTKGTVRWWTMTLAMLLTIVISSPFGGMLWQIHDMQHGFIPDSYQTKLVQGIIWGLGLGLPIAVLSVPMNLVGFTVGYIVLNRLAKLAKHPHRSGKLDRS
jgi:hypothetical protein